MFIKQMTVGSFATNCYLLSDEESREGYVIDPGGEGEKINREIERLSLKVKGILLTHGHWDHFEAVDTVADWTGAPVMMHRADHFQYTRIPSFFGTVPAPKTAVLEFLIEGQKLQAGNLTLQVLETPGHTPGGISFYDGKSAVFCGDTLFCGSVGRCDLPGGNWEVLKRSIQDVLFVLPDEVTVYSGHGPATEIGRERKTNPYV